MEEKDFEDWQSDEEISFQGLLDSSKTFSSVESMIEDYTNTFQLNLSTFITPEEFDNIKLVNFIRSWEEGRKGVSLALDDIRQLEELLSSKEHLVGERYLSPVLEDDPLLFLINDFASAHLGYEMEEGEGDESRDVRRLLKADEDDERKLTDGKDDEEEEEEEDDLQKS